MRRHRIVANQTLLGEVGDARPIPRWFELPVSTVVASRSAA
ncbi:MAG TPA: hypothetical protein VM388_07345 [Acidimicrobiales bacterium]|nr:hypothetical protein [Acidimicrobiales bacterium]